MSQKRQQREDAARPFCSDGGGSRASHDKRRRTFKSVVQDVMTICRFQNYMEPVMEPLLRRVVKEEVELAIRKYFISVKWNSDKDVRTSEPRSLRLQFSSTISLPVFTGSRIEGDDCNNLRIALVDSLTGKVVSSGPQASAKVEIVVLEGDFDVDERNNWTAEDFKSNIVREREGKKPLLNGDVFLTLKEGTGLAGDISFTDNSSWTRSRKFRLGARVVDYFDGTRVRAAKTESFVVRDHRGELYKKHHPPSLSDEVWRLEKIGKDGAFHKRLNKERVYTVKDFLTLLTLDPVRLRNVLGTGMSSKMWEVTVEHAWTCLLDNKVHLYPSGLQQKTSVIFNVVGQVIGLLTEGQYIASDKLSETEKDEAQNLVISAFRHQDNVVSFDNEASCMDSISQLTRVGYTSSLPLGYSDIDKASTSQNIGREDNLLLGTFSPDMTSAIYSMPCFDDFGLTDPVDVRFNQHLNYSSQVAAPFGDDADSIVQALFEDENLIFSDPCSLQDPKFELSTNQQGASSGRLAQTTGISFPRAQRRRWTMLSSVLKMVFRKKTRN